MLIRLFEFKKKKTNFKKHVGCVCMCIYIMEYYSAIKKNEIIPFAVTWMDLEMTRLSEVGQTCEDKYDIT